MSRRRRGRAVHGWVVLDKPAGITSATAVARVRGAFGAAKAGHGGTLDPLATGVLPVALGEATKTVTYVVDGSKTYEFTVRWGAATTTDDADGEVLCESDVRPDAAAIEDVLGGFVGTIEQVPPRFSAVKVDGERAYGLARAGRSVTLEPRSVRIDAFRLLGFVDADHARFEVKAGKGAYMRALARDIAQRLGTVGHITQLRRTAVGPFHETTAISLDNVVSVRHISLLEEFLLPVATALADIPALALTEVEATYLRQGRPVAALPVASRSPLTRITRGAVVCAMAAGKPVALAKISGGEIRPVRVLNL